MFVSLPHSRLTVRCLQARLKREAEERERQALLDAKAAEQARLDAERARLAAEPTFTIASVPVNKLRPFYFFAAGYQPIKRFLAKEEKIDLHLMSHGRRLCAPRTCSFVAGPS